MRSEPSAMRGAAAPRSSLLARIAAALPQLRKSERSVAERVLAQPNEVLHLSIAEMARRVGASQPTVARFAAAMGFSGYKEFKLRLAQSLASGMPFVHQDVRPDDTVELVTSKVFDRAIGALIEVRNQLDPAALKRAIRILAGARRIECYGVGNSGIVALDAQHKLFRYGVPTASYVDTHAMGMAAAQRLLAVLSGQEVAEPIVVPVELVRRASTGPVGAYCIRPGGCDG